MARWLVGAVLTLGALGGYPERVAAQEGGDLEPARASPLTIAKQRLEQAKGPAPVSRPEDEANRPVPKIVGGELAKKGQFPWQVALIHSAAPDDNLFLGHFCGGTLIDWRWILTAAHCTYEGNDKVLAKAIDVLVGSHDFNGGERIKVKDIVRHKGYVHGHFQDNDISLLELAAEPKDKAGLDLVTKGGDDRLVQPQMFGTVVGWGSTVAGVVPAHQRKSVQELQYIEDITFHDSGACNAEHMEARRAWYRKVLQKKGMTPTAINNVLDKYYPQGSTLVTGNMVCAGTNNGTKDACFNDSGGPLLVRRGEHQLVQVGIVSWGAPGGCALTDLYGVYTRLSRYDDWIRENMR